MRENLAEELCHEAFASEFVPLIRAKGEELIGQGRDSRAAQNREKGRGKVGERAHLRRTFQFARQYFRRTLAEFGVL